MPMWTESHSPQLRSLNLNLKKRERTPKKWVCEVTEAEEEEAATKTNNTIENQKQQFNPARTMPGTTATEKNQKPKSPQT